MDFTIEQATPDDDPAIRRLLANNPVPGSITVTYEREPNYFWGCDTMGPLCQVFVARHNPTGQVAGVACLATRPLYVNGQIETVGYLGQLRVDEPFRGRWLVSRAFRFFHQLQIDSETTGYITTIIEGNIQAEGLLVKRARRHFPLYQALDRICTAVVIVGRPKKNHASPYDIRRGSKQNLSAIVSFLGRHSSTKQFFPLFTEADFSTGSTTRGFQIEDFLLAYQGETLVGVIGLWDQSDYKQTTVQSYNNSLRRIKPFFNLGGRLLGFKPLPAPGQPLHFAYASFICVAENNPAIFKLLLRQVYNLTAQRGYAYLMVGLSERDPLLAEVGRYVHVPYYSRLYSVCWKEDLSFHEKLDGRVPYVEIATL
ncbi:MAG: hypothetical protein GY764_04775 [Halieaceae bacterium]|nr:hypothetical protein [Halieaceae bacterium]